MAPWGGSAARWAVAAVVMTLACAMVVEAQPPTAIAATRRPVQFASTAALDSAGRRVGGCQMPDARPPTGQRRFVSSSVEALISDMLPRFKDPNMGRLFANALPNTLDTTVFYHGAAQPGGGAEAGAAAAGGGDAPTPVELDSFIITGDIDAMWLRDSANQVRPYVALAANDTALAGLLRGVIRRHAVSLLIDTHANSFNFNGSGSPGPHQDDATSNPSFAGTRVDAMNPAVFERKYELDSLVNTLRLACDYHAATGDASPFDTRWQTAVSVALDTMVAQQRNTSADVAQPDYQFQRTTAEPTDSLEHGIGHYAASTGMIKSAFRGSDDATTFPFNIPENAFAVVTLRDVAKLLTAVGRSDLAARATALASEVDAGIQKFGTMVHPVAGKVYAYEVDGTGNALFMDDANVPSLLALPYLGYVDATDPLYVNTRKAVLSPANPYYYSGSAVSGVGGPHNGYGWVWPMALISQAITSQDTSELTALLATLVASSSCSGLIHESVWKDNMGSFTRPWFAWANSYFAGLILQVAQQHPTLIFSS